jgi:D-alanyl-D-alanine carboxypeptidase
MLAAPVPPYVAVVQPVAPADVRSSWRPGCPVGPAQLRTVRLSYWGFDGERRIGRLVVRRTVAGDVVTAFRSLYRAHFPIRRIVPVSAYRGSDDASMAADNTSGFNCRRVPGSSSWSEHAYGEAIDVNPVENPYLAGGRVQPPAARAFLNRARVRRGMAVEGNALVRAFDAVGWGWGGRWTSSLDYQHFSRSGR